MRRRRNASINTGGGARRPRLWAPGCRAGRRGAAGRLPAPPLPNIPPVPPLPRAHPGRLLSIEACDELGDSSEDEGQTFIE